jgi:hypothetical protein
MPPYCPSCFRDLPSEDAECRRCRTSEPRTATALLLGGLVFAVVMTGVLTLNARVCLAGAAIGVIALAVHLIARSG